jgi:hypothetical protein
MLVDMMWVVRFATEEAMTKRPEPCDLAVIAVDDIPQSFRWRGHRYVVQTIVMHWIETGPWWQSLAQTFYRAQLADVDSNDVTWRIWRVEARSMAGVIVGDLAYRESLTSSVVDPWRMIRVVD